MNPVRVYKLQPVTPPPDILDQFSDKMKLKIDPVVKQLRQNGVQIQPNGQFHLPNGKVLTNGLNILRYITYPKFFNLEKPRGYNTVNQYLKGQNIVQQQITPLTWISYK